MMLMVRFPGRPPRPDPRERLRLHSLIDKYGINLETLHVLCPLKQHCTECVPFVGLAAHKKKRHSRSCKYPNKTSREKTCKEHRAAGTAGLSHVLACESCTDWLLRQTDIPNGTMCHVTCDSPLDTPGGRQLWGWGPVMDTIFAYVGGKLAPYRIVSKFFNCGIVNNPAWRQWFCDTLTTTRAAWKAAVQCVNEDRVAPNDPWVISFHKTYLDVFFIQLGTGTVPRLLWGGSTLRCVDLPKPIESSSSDTDSSVDIDLI
eukprot:TRINITY_DN67572_c5_g1_i1.p1 TRINITY_DN67572_c5_g1~~TRINITY_DN67572_c5_g1_i1.p1  ORF type:complete len:259 (-),score=-3.04 TRINITY_DN67572_c5_g1_i1:220-996(-)